MDYKGQIIALTLSAVSALYGCGNKNNNSETTIIPTYQAPVAKLTTTPVNEWYTNDSGKISVEQSTIPTTGTTTLKLTIDDVTRSEGVVNGLENIEHIFSNTGNYIIKACLKNENVAQESCDTMTKNVYKKIDSPFTSIEGYNTTSIDKILAADTNIAYDFIKNKMKQNPENFSQTLKDLFLDVDKNGVTYKNALFDTIITNGTDEALTIWHPAYNREVNVVGVNPNTKEFYLPVMSGSKLGDNLNQIYFVDGRATKVGESVVLTGKFTDEEYTALTSMSPPTIPTTTTTTIPLSTTTSTVPTTTTTTIIPTTTTTSTSTMTSSTTTTTPLPQIINTTPSINYNLPDTIYQGNLEKLVLSIADNESSLEKLLVYIDVNNSGTPVYSGPANSIPEIYLATQSLGIITGTVKVDDAGIISNSFFSYIVSSYSAPTTTTTTTVPTTTTTTRYVAPTTTTTIPITTTTTLPIPPLPPPPPVPFTN